MKKLLALITIVAVGAAAIWMLLRAQPINNEKATAPAATTPTTTSPAMQFARAIERIRTARAQHPIEPDQLQVSTTKQSCVDDDDRCELAFREYQDFLSNVKPSDEQLKEIQSVLYDAQETLLDIQLEEIRLIKERPNSREQTSLSSEAIIKYDYIQDDMDAKLRNILEEDQRRAFLAHGISAYNLDHTRHNFSPDGLIRRTPI